MKLFIASTVVLLATGVNAFAPPYKSTKIGTSTSTSTSTSIDLFDGKKGSGDMGGLVNQLNIFGKNKENPKNTKQVLSMESAVQGEVSKASDDGGNSILVGRVAAWSTSLAACVVILVGMLQQLIKTVVFGFLPASISNILTPVAWIAALATFYFVPFPLSVLPSVIGLVFGLIGIPSFGGKKDETTAPAAVATDDSDEEDGGFSIFKTLITSAKRIVLLFLAFAEAVIGLSPVAENKGFFWDKLYAGETQIFPPTSQEKNKFPKEKWIYINGIATDAKSAKQNAKIMYSMFGRPVTAVHNPTDGFALDLLECIAGKTDLVRYGEIEPRKVLMAYITKTLKEAKANGIEKVVLIAHSQGTIITGNTIRLLGEGEDEEVKKLMKELLEVHTFAGCAHKMPGNYCRYLENLSNGGDVVAWLGHIFPGLLKSLWFNTKVESIDYSNGESFVEDKDWGHLLVPHYLDPMMDGKFSTSMLAKEYLKDGN